MASLLKVDCIMYRVHDPERAARFYMEAFGLRRAWTDADNGMIGLVLPESDTEIVVHNDAAIPNPDFSFLVADVAAAAAAHRTGGFAVIVEPFDVRCGKCAVLADLDGNAVSIIDLTKFGGLPRRESAPSADLQS